MAGRPTLDIFRLDTRATEGLPVRLVVALVVDVASISVMLSVFFGVQGLVTSEFDVKPTLDVVGPDKQALNFTVVDHEGSPAEGATAIVKSGTAEIDDVATARSDDGGSATINVDTELNANHRDGTLVMDVKPPVGESFVDRRKNMSVLVIQD